MKAILRGREVTGIIVEHGNDYVDSYVSDAVWADTDESLSDEALEALTSLLLDDGDMYEDWLNYKAGIAEDRAEAAHDAYEGDAS